MSAGEMEMGTKHSAMSSDATPLQGKLKPSKSFQLNLAWSVSKSYQGNLRDIANRGNHLAAVLLGSGAVPVSLYISIVTNVMSNLLTAWVGSALILIFYGDMQTGATPTEICAALLCISIAFATEAMLRMLVVNHAGIWMLRRAKYAISQIPGVSLSESAEADMMGHLHAMKNLFVNNWADSWTNFSTEMLCIVFVGFFSPALMGIAFGLFLLGKVFSSLDDYFLISEQLKINDMGRDQTASSSKYEQANRFFHNGTTAHHVVVKLAHVLYSYMAPIMFVMFAANATVSDAASWEPIPLSSAMSAVIFYAFAARCHINQHGTTTNVIRNLYHAERVLEFDKEGQIQDVFADGKAAELPYSNKPTNPNKKSKSTTATHSEKAGVLFTAVAIGILFIMSVVLVTSVDLSCRSKVITCGHMPDDGSNVELEVPTVFNVRRGCEMQNSIADIMDQCTKALLAEEATADEENDEDFEDTTEDDEDVSFELEAVAEEQSASSAQPMSQSEVVTVTAKYSSWSGVQQFQQQQYQPFVSSEDDERRLTTASSGSTTNTIMSARPSEDAYKGPSRKYKLKMTVGSGRNDGSGDSLSVIFVGTSGLRSEPVSVGKGWAKGKTRKVEVEASVDVGNVERLVLVSGGKNGLLFSGIEVDETYVLSNPMTMLKCRGKKKDGTWNCNEEVHVRAYTVEVVVGSASRDKSKMPLEIELVGASGTLKGSLGNNWASGETRVIDLPRTTDLGALSAAKLYGGSTDGLRVVSLKVDSFYENAAEMSSEMIDCVGSSKTARKKWGINGGTECIYDIALGTINPDAVVTEDTGCRPECDESLQGACVEAQAIAPVESATMLFPGVAESYTEELTYGFGSVWNRCGANGPVRFTYKNRCDQGCAERGHTFKLSPEAAWSSNSDGGCQQKNGKSYPKYCTDPDYYKDGAPWSMAGLSSKEQKMQCPVSKYRLAHDRGHQIPANAFDGDKTVCKNTNFMTNIQPQADKMNRGAWLKTEMMVECWRNEAPVTVVGGAVFLADGPGTAEQRLADHPWEVDRTEWFVESHNIKNPAYFWKVIVLAAETDKGTKQRHQAFWMPNHESATAKKVNDYLVSIPELEQFLTDWGAPESFTLDDKELFSDSVWKDPRGCNRM